MEINEISLEDARRLYDVLDVSRDGHVDVEEFFCGCERVKGSARNIDIATLLMHTSYVTNQLHIFMIDLAW